MEYVIYKIVSNNIEVKYAYVGHTTNFTQRNDCHKSNSNNEKKAHMKIYIIINEHGGWACWRMVILETCFCESKAEAVTIETKYYDQLIACLNTNRPMLTTEERKEIWSAWHKKHYIDNKDAYKEKNKQYQTANKEKFRAQNSEKILCEVCECYHTRGSKWSHIKTTKHLKNLELNNSVSKSDL
jgi:hypothetical protein